jgi:hypothetical protein
VASDALSLTASDAHISECGRYRYYLSRIWGPEPPVCWIMLNPSTADADQDDPTIRRCMGFARSWGAGGIIVVNLFAFRATNPAELERHYNLRGWPQEMNDRLILEQSKSLRLIAAWGCHGALHGRDVHLCLTLDYAYRRAECLGLTRDGHPRHPLYVRAAAQPIPFDLLAPLRRLP